MASVIPGLLRRLTPTTTRCVSPHAPHPRRGRKVRHFSARYRTRLSVSVAPWPGARRLADCLSRRQSLEVLLDRFHPASRRAATAVLTLGVRATHRSFLRHATPTLGLGWSIWSTNALRRRLNAAALLVSGGHPYSLAIPVYYGPLRLSPKRRQGVSRLVSGGLDVTWAVNPSASGP